MNDEFKLQVTPKEGDSGLSLSKVRSGLIARGRKDAEMLAALAEAESELAPESEIKRLHDLYDLHVSDDGRSLEVLRQDAKRGDAKSQYLIAESPGRHPGPQVEPMKWLRKAAEQDFAPAQFRLGAMYDGDLFARMASLGWFADLLPPCLIGVRAGRLPDRIS